jgi:DNA-binding response OmpR family regulator
MRFAEDSAVTLSAEGYEVDVVPDGTAGLEMLRQRPPVAVILDIERSGYSEFDFCRQIAKSIPNTPLIIRSARSDAADKVVFLWNWCRSLRDHSVQKTGVDSASACTNQARVALPTESMSGSVRVTASHHQLQGHGR